MYYDLILFRPMHISRSFDADGLPYAIYDDLDEESDYVRGKRRSHA